VAFAYNYYFYFFKKTPIGATPNCFAIVAEDSLAREAFVNKIKLFYGNQNYAILSASPPQHAAPRHVLFPYWAGL
jgi:hypothetical protein